MKLFYNDVETMMWVDPDRLIEIKLLFFSTSLLLLFFTCLFFFRHCDIVLLQIVVIVRICTYGWECKLVSQKVRFLSKRNTHTPNQDHEHNYHNIIIGLFIYNNLLHCHAKCSAQTKYYYAIFTKWCKICGFNFSPNSIQKNCIYFSGCSVI